MTHMMRTGDSWYEVGNTHIIIVFAQTEVSMELNPRMEFKF